MATSASNRGIRHVALTGRPGWYHFRYRLFYQTCMSHSTAVNTVNKKQTTLYLYMFVRFAGFGGVFFVVMCPCFLSCSLEQVLESWLNECARYLYILFI